jgi:hypothetical protein
MSMPAIVGTSVRPVAIGGNCEQNTNWNLYGKSFAGLLTCFLMAPSWVVAANLARFFFIQLSFFSNAMTWQINTHASISAKYPLPILFICSHCTRLLASQPNPEIVRAV